MRTAVCRACGLAVCLWLCSLGSLPAQAEPAAVSNGSDLPQKPQQREQPSRQGLDPSAGASKPVRVSRTEPSPPDLPAPERLPRLAPSRPQTPATGQSRLAAPETEESSLFPNFPLLNQLGSPLPTSADLGIDWDRLALLPDLELAEEMDRQFSRRLARLNRQIANQQERLYRLLQTWDSDEDAIRQTQAQLSQLRLERDRLALEHLLILRQLQENFALPLPSRSAAGSP